MRANTVANINTFFFFCFFLWECGSVLTPTLDVLHSAFFYLKDQFTYIAKNIPKYINLPRSYVPSYLL